MEGTRRPRRFFPRINPIKRFDNDLFVKRYRLDKESVIALSRAYENSPFCLTSCDPRGGGITAQERMCVALRYYATGSNYSVLGDFQGLSKSTVCRAVGEVTEFLFNNQTAFIKWPTTWEAKYDIARQYHEKSAVPFCMGAIDGTHVAILSPCNNEVAYVNRKGYHSLNVMVVSDSNHMFLHVDPRYPGSVNDAFVLLNSEVSLQGGGGTFGRFYLLGDSGYPLKRYLLTPTLQPNGTREEREYNLWHRRTRAGVEQSIGILKQRFRCIDDSGGYLYHTPEMCGKIVTACACLHNYAIAKKLPLPLTTMTKSTPG